MYEARAPSELIPVEKRKDFLFAEQAFRQLKDDESITQAKHKAVKEEIAELSSFSESNSKREQDIFMVNEQLKNGK